MGADADLKLMSSPAQAVGLLVVLADSGNAMLHAFGKQELWRHVLDSNPCLDGRRVESTLQTLDIEAQAPVTCSGEDSKGRVKKVRFAPDVVEPEGSSQVYHGQNKGNIMAKKNTCAVKKEDQEIWHDTNVNLEVGLLKSSPVGSSCKAQTLGKPYLPTNRMLLYKGKQLSRARMANDL